MASIWDTTYLKALVERVGREPRRTEGEVASDDMFECDCCGTLIEVISQFENHLVWGCGRRFGCKVVRQVAPTQGRKGEWYAENVQTGLTYQGYILGASSVHLEGLADDELRAETVRRESLMFGALCNHNKANKPKAHRMSYRLYQEKAWSSTVGYWKNNSDGMIPMRHNPDTREDEAVPGPEELEEPDEVNIHERQFQTWQGRGMDNRLRRDDSAPDFYVDNMSVLLALLAGAQEQPSTHEQDVQPDPSALRDGQLGTSAVREAEPVTPSWDSSMMRTREQMETNDREHIKAMTEIDRHRTLDRQMQARMQLANARQEIMDIPPKSERPYGVFWDGLDEVQGMLRLRGLLKILGERNLIFPGFESADNFITIGFKLLKVSDGDIDEAAKIAEELHIKTKGKWSQAAWDEYRNAQVAREMLASRT
ncbi:hypothetical protein DV735_g5284, partial [Chaetothyriales sp. CBS 134920]